EVVLADGGKPGLLTTRGLKREIVVGAVFFDRSAEGKPRLHARVRGIWRVAEWIHRLNVAVAQVTKCRSVKIVCARFRDDVDHAARRPPIFGFIAVGEDLKFLNTLLRDGGADPVHRVVYCIHAVNIYGVGARALAAEVQT